MVGWFPEFSFTLEETFLTRNKQGVVRGMHLQTGIAAGWRLVSCIEGAVFDVCLDLNPLSDSFGTVATGVLSDTELTSVLIPPGVSHGFQALTDSTLLYQTTKSYSPELDTGVKYDSFGVEWPISISAISPRDMNLMPFKDWNYS